MKVRGSLTITKGLKLPNPGGLAPTEGLVALSDATGKVLWGNLAMPALDLGDTYSRTGTLALHENDVYYSIIDNALGSSFADPLVWTKLTGGTDSLTQDQLDALNGANAPSSANPFMTLADIRNITILGTSTLTNILANANGELNQIWLTNTAGTDSFGTTVAVGDGLISTGTSYQWRTVGQMTGTAGPEGPTGPTGSGVSIKGSTTVDNILASDPSPAAQMWVATDTGVDDLGAVIKAGDGVASDGINWYNIGPFRGPKGETAYTGTYLITGGISWVTGYQYVVSADQYVITGDLYSASPQTIQLTPSDPTLNRIDVFVADINGTIMVLQGVPAEFPVKPEVNESRFVTISFVEIAASTTEPAEVLDTPIYDENLGIAGGEWDTSVTTSNGASIDLDYTGDYYSGTKSIRIQNASNEKIKFSIAPGTLDLKNEVELFTLRVKSLSATTTANTTVRLFNGENKIGSALNLADFGYNYTNITAWQLVTFYIADFGATASSIDSIELNIEAYSPTDFVNILVDSIGYQSGLNIIEDDPLEYTSELVNDGEDGINPFITELDLEDLHSVAYKEVPSEIPDGINTVFTTTHTATSPNFIWVYMDGVGRTDFVYNKDTNEITFGFPPETGTDIVIQYISALSGISPEVVQTSQLQNDGEDSVNPFISLDTQAVTDWNAVSGPEQLLNKPANLGGLESLDEGNGIGYRLKGANPAKYVNIGLGSVDLTTLDQWDEADANTDYGVGAEYSFSAGEGNRISGPGYSSSVGFYNNISQGGGILLGSYNTLSSTDSANSIVGANNNLTGGSGGNTIIGQSNTLSSASGGYNAVVGSDNTISSTQPGNSVTGTHNSILSGYGNSIQGLYNVITTDNNGFAALFGMNNRASGTGPGGAMGTALDIRGRGQSAVGIANTIWGGGNMDANRPMFTVGIGTSTTPAGAWAAITREDGFVVQADGLATLPSVTNVLIEANAKSIITKEYGDANYLGGGGSELSIEVTKQALDALITGSILVPGTLYKITGVHPTLYDDGNTLGTTIYLRALTSSTLDSNGTGEFWNPRYDSEDPNSAYGLFNPYMETEDIFEAGFYYSDEEIVTADNGATGKIISPVTIAYLSGDWGSVNSMTGASSGVTQNISSMSNIPAYAMGDEVYWGGYAWVNLTGNVGEYIDIHTLSADWVKVYFSDVSYIKVFDVISYDYENDFIVKRHELESNNRVSCTYATTTSLRVEDSTISSFMFGTIPVDTKSKGLAGISNVTVDQASFPCINFAGFGMMDVMVTNCYFEKLVFLYEADMWDCTFSEVWGGSFSLIDASSLYSVNIKNSDFSYMMLQNSSTIMGITALNEASLYDCSLTNSGLGYTHLDGGSFYSNNVVDSFISNLRIDSDSRLYDMTFQDSSSEYTRICRGSNISNISFDPGDRFSYNDFDSVTFSDISLSTDSLLLQEFTKSIYERPDGELRVRYYNDSDVLVIGQITDDIDTDVPVATK